MEKRIDLPLDTVAAQHKFAELLDVPGVLFVVLGNSPAATRLVVDAVTQAGCEGDPIRVVWARNPEAIREEVAKLQGVAPDMDTPDQAFAVSCRYVSSVIGAAEGPPDPVRIFACMMTCLEEDVP